MSALFHSRNLSSPFPFFGNGTICGDELRIVMGVQGAFPLAHGGNYSVITRSESGQKILLTNLACDLTKGGAQ